MTELLSAAQMRATESAAIASGAVTGLELMERAGRGVVEAIFTEWPKLAAAPQRAVVLCGPGNNGGDGFVVARLLKQWGWDVLVSLYGSADKLPPDAKTNYDRWCEMGAVTPLDAQEWEGPSPLHRSDLVVDALFGTGLVRAVDLPLDTVSALRVGAGHKVVSIDIPSGICSDSGKHLGPATAFLRADLTVAFHREKLGHRLADGAATSGKVVVKSIGLERLDCGGDHIQRVKLAEVTAPMLAKENDAHKYGHGHALVLTGGAGLTGAARLAARAALRVGAGLVTLGVPRAAEREVACQITALMQSPVDEPQDLVERLDDTRINALCLGPGLGVARAPSLVEVALNVDHRPAVVLDADALTGFADAPEALFAMLHEGCVLTPHSGEFGRLFPDLAEMLNAPADAGPAYSKVDATRAAAARAGCVVLLKGADTVIAAPDGACSIHSARYARAAPWLATAGSGDVLAGFITGLLARGFTPFEAAQAAAWLHVECARRFGPGLIAEDLPDALPDVLRDLGL